MPRIVSGIDLALHQPSFLIDTLRKERRTVEYYDSVVIFGHLAVYFRAVFPKLVHVHTANASDPAGCLQCALAKDG